MTDFGRRVTGVGDMLKSVYDTDDDGYVDGLKDHKELHQDGGDEEIALTGLVGATPRAIFGDQITGRVLRFIDLNILDGGGDSTIKPSATNLWNGDDIAEEDNLAKNGDTGNFALSADGLVLTIKSSGLTGNAVAALNATILQNFSSTLMNVLYSVSSGNILIEIQAAGTGLSYDLTALVDVAPCHLKILYLTHA